MGETGLGVGGCATAAVSLPAFAAGLAGRGDGLLACGASDESAAGGDAVGFGVASGGGEAARAALESGTCAAEGEATIGAATTGELTGAAAASSVDACFAGCAALADTEAKAGDSGILPSETRALSSVGDSSDPTVLAGAGCAVSLSGVASATVEAATMSWLGCAAVAGPWGAATKDGALGMPVLTPRPTPISAAPARASADALSNQTPERGSVANPAGSGSCKGGSPNSQGCGASTSTEAVPLGSSAAMAADACSRAASGDSVGSGSVLPGVDRVSSGDGEWTGLMP